jgi:RNA-binding protein PNO1
VLDSSAMNTLAVEAFEPSAADDADASMDVDDEEGRPNFAPAKDGGETLRIERRKVPVPPNRMSPLRAAWPKIYTPYVEIHLPQLRANETDTFT